MDSIKLTKGERQKAKIVSEALKILGKKGLEGLSFQKVADRCKISQSAVIHHYGSKDKLFSALVTHVVRDNHIYIEKQILNEDSGRERLEKYFRYSLKWAQEYPDRSRVIVLLYFYSSLKKEFSLIYQQILNRVNDRLVEYLLAASREGELRSSESIPTIARLLHQNLIGAIINECTRPANRLAPSRVVEDWHVLFKELLD